MRPLMIRLGVNLDHVATVRQARQTFEPDPVQAAVLAQLGGADSITVHLREDRRHVQERDLELLIATAPCGVNMELAVDDEVLAIATRLRPRQCCLVPEKRAELTTEGGLRVVADDARLRRAIKELQGTGIEVSLFIEPDDATIRLAADYGADAVELHTGTWANAWQAAHGGEAGAADRCRAELERLEHAAHTVAECGLRCHAGHGITYHNVYDLLHLPLLAELNIGHTIVARALLVGMERAVRDMRQAIDSRG